MSANAPIAEISPSRVSTYRVELPLPPIDCSPNRGAAHWAIKHKARRSHAASCVRALKAAGIPPLQTPIRVHLAFYLCRPTDTLGKFRVRDLYFPRDRDNAIASAKGAQDALKEAGIIPDDGARHVEIAPPDLFTRREEHQGRTCLVMTITTLEEASR